MLVDMQVAKPQARQAQQYSNANEDTNIVNAHCDILSKMLMITSKRLCFPGHDELGMGGPCLTGKQLRLVGWLMLVMPMLMSNTKCLLLL